MTNHGNLQPKSFMDTDINIDFFDPNTLHDRVLVVEEKKFYVNSMHLSQFSEFFNGLFNANFVVKNENEIILEEVEAEDFDNFLHAMYPMFAVTDISLPSLMQLSCRFLSPSVWVQCISFLKRDGNLNTFTPRILLECSEGSDSIELRMLIENDLIAKTPTYVYLPFEGIDYHLELSVQYNLDKLKSHLEQCLFDGMYDYLYKVEELLYVSEKYGFVELKQTLETHLVERLVSGRFNIILEEALRNILQINLPNLKKAFSSEVRAALYGFSDSPIETNLLIQIFVRNLDPAIQSNTEVILSDLFTRESNKKDVLERYFKICKEFHLEFLKSVLVDFLEDKLNEPTCFDEVLYVLMTAKKLDIMNVQQRADMSMSTMFLKSDIKKDIMNDFLVVAKERKLISLQETLEKWLCSLEFKDDQQALYLSFGAIEQCKMPKLKEILNQYIKESLVEFSSTGSFAVFEVKDGIFVKELKESVSRFLREQLNTTEQDAEKLRVLLQLADKYGLVLLQNAVATFLANDFGANKTFKYVQLVIEFNLEELKELMAYKLRTCKLSDLAVEDKNFLFHSSAEVKDFVLRHSFNL